MTIATITWDLPAVSPSQRPLAAVRPEVSADGGANFTTLPNVPAADTQEVVISDIAAGDWLIRLTVIDSSGAESAGLDTPFAIPFDVPGDVTNVNVALS